MLLFADNISADNISADRDKNRSPLLQLQLLPYQNLIIIHSP